MEIIIDIVLIIADFILASGISYDKGDSKTLKL